MLEYFSYQKLKKHQAEKAAREAAAASAKDSPAITDNTPTASPTTVTNPNVTIQQPQEIPLPQTPDLTPQLAAHHDHTHNIPRKPLPVLTKEDEDFLRGFVSDVDDTPENRPLLPTRPAVDVEALKVAGDATGNEAQLVVHEGHEKW